MAALVVHMISDRIAPLHYDIKTMYKYWGLLQYSESVGPYYNCTKLHIKKFKASLMQALLYLVGVYEVVFLLQVVLLRKIRSESSSTSWQTL